MRKDKRTHSSKNLIAYATNGNLSLVKFFVEKDADIHFEYNAALRYSAYNGQIEIVKFFIFDSNMVIKENNLSETINIINTRGLHNSLNNELDNKSKNKQKVKV